MALSSALVREGFRPLPRLLCVCVCVLAHGSTSLGMVRPSRSTHMLRLRGGTASSSSGLRGVCDENPVVRMRDYARTQGRASDTKLVVGVQTGAGAELYRARWSRRWKAGQLEVSNDRRSVYNPHFFESMDEDVIWEAWSVRADRPLPSSGRHYFEVSISQNKARTPDELPADTLEEGWNTVGLVGAVETCFSGWWWRDERRQHTWGVHDSMRAAYVSISDPEHQASKWARGGSFGNHDTVGMLVDMDARECHVFVNSKYKGMAFRNLPEIVFPLVTLVAGETTAVLHTALHPPRIDPASPIPLVFGYAGAPGLKYGQCRKLDHAAKGCSGLCDPEEHLSDDEYMRTFNHSKLTAEEKLRQDKECLQEGLEHLMEAGREVGAEAYLHALCNLDLMRDRKLAASRSRNDASCAKSQTLRLAPPAGAGKKMAGKLAQDMVHAAASGAAFNVARGVYQFQRHPPWAKVAAFLRQGGDADSVFTQEQITGKDAFHDRDAIVVAANCSHTFMGAERDKCMFWGRWRALDSSSGGFSKLSLVADAPMLFDATLHVWGDWDFTECNIKSSAGTALRLERRGVGSCESCVVGGDGPRSRSARVGIEGHESSRISMRDCMVAHAGYWLRAAAVKMTHHASCVLERVWVCKSFLCVELDMAASVSMSSCVVHPCHSALFLVNAPYWEERLYPSDPFNEEEPDEGRIMDRCVDAEAEGANISVGQQQDPVWGSVQWEQERLLRRGEHWGFSNEYVAARVADLDGQIASSHAETQAQDWYTRRSKEGQARLRGSLWDVIGNESELMLDNSTFYLNAAGAGCEFLTPDRPRTMQRVSPCRYVSEVEGKQEGVLGGETLPPLAQLWRVCALVSEQIQPVLDAVDALHAQHADEGIESAGGARHLTKTSLIGDEHEGIAEADALGPAEKSTRVPEDEEVNATKGAEAYASSWKRDDLLLKIPKQDQDDQVDSTGQETSEGLHEESDSGDRTKPRCPHGSRCNFKSLVPNHSMQFYHPSRKTEACTAARLRCQTGDKAQLAKRDQEEEAAPQCRGKAAVQAALDAQLAELGVVLSKGDSKIAGDWLSYLQGEV